jgi:hypothetical protein
MKNVCYLHHNGFLIFEQRLGSISRFYWVIQNDCREVWQLCTKIYVATLRGGLT